MSALNPIAMTAEEAIRYLTNDGRPANPRGRRFVERASALMGGSKDSRADRTVARERILECVADMEARGKLEPVGGSGQYRLPRPGRMPPGHAKGRPKTRRYRGIPERSGDD